jgi:hypothetical protein
VTGKEGGQNAGDLFGGSVGQRDPGEHHARGQVANGQDKPADPVDRARRIGQVRRPDGAGSLPEEPVEPGETPPAVAQSVLPERALEGRARRPGEELPQGRDPDVGTYLSKKIKDELAR